jgi:hypothetical protein
MDHYQDFNDVETQNSTLEMIRDDGDCLLQISSVSLPFHVSN